MKLRDWASIVFLLSLVYLLVAVCFLIYEQGQRG